MISQSFRLENSAMRNKGETLADAWNAGVERISMPPIFFIHSFRKKSEAPKIRDPHVIFHVRSRRKSIRSIALHWQPKQTTGNNRRAIFEHTRVFGLAGADREKANGRPSPPPPFFEAPLGAQVDIKYTRTWIFRVRGACTCATSAEGSYVHERGWVRGRAVVCDAYHPPPPRTARYCVYMHIYRGKPPDSPLYSNSAAFSDIPAETLDRKAPAFECTPVIHRPRNPLSTSRRFLSLSRRGHPAHSRRLSYATSSRHIRTKSNVFRLNGFVSVVHNYPLLPPSFPPILLPSTRSKYLL